MRKGGVSFVLGLGLGMIMGMGGGILGGVSIFGSSMMRGKGSLGFNFGSFSLASSKGSLK